jgi:monofunctional glycosyltransferase
MRRTTKRKLWRIIALLLAIFLGYQAWIAGHIFWWVHHNPSTSSFMENTLETLQDKNPHAELRHRWLPYSRISNNLKRALVAAEDAKFVDHDGFDWEGIADAAEKNLHRGRIVAGGSTISQQLAKNLFLSKQRTPWRKAEEALITVMLEAIMDKRRIFEIYLNIIEWGNGIFGAEAAAHHYYHINAADLTPEQAAQMAAMVPNPRFYDRHRNSRSLARRTAIILDRMDYAEIP